LKQRKIEGQPITDLIIQIESSRDLIEGKNAKFPDVPGSPRRNVEEEKAKRNARELLPKLERRLIALLVQFKEKHGYDYEFNGVNYGQLYVQESTSADTVQTTKWVSPVKKPRDISYGEQLLLEKMHRSLMVGGGGSLSARPQKIRRQNRSK
jgi:hypothetical protein